MNTYEEKRQARFERLESRIERLRKIAATNDLSLFGEERSGIPMGQPILVGHHSERRHRRHLERLHRLCQKGYDAGKMADKLESRLVSARNSAAIQSDNPEASTLLASKLKRLEAKRDEFKRINVAVRACGGDPIKLADILKCSDTTASQLLTPDFAGRIGIPAYVLTNIGAEIRRLKKRIETVAVVQDVGSFEPFIVERGPGSQIGVELVDGQIQIEFPWKPNEESRKAIKRLAFKWSRYSERWVRKHTASTCGEWFRRTLIDALKETTK